jgi:glyoxylase-like metal-dependent hydrolase (beta-lactamase superfamily II)
MEEKHFGPIWFIPGEQGGRYPFCHSVYIEGAGLLIDPASDRERLIQLRNDPGVKGVWLSHWHEDHLMHLDLFDNLPLWISEPDAPPLTDLESFMDAYGMDQADERAFFREIMVKDFHFQSRRPTGFLQEGTENLMDGLTIEVISTPGHTPGHTAFFFKEQGVLFMGDYDLTKFGPWYGDAESSIEETIASVRRLRNIPAKVWIAGHEAGLFEADPNELWERYLDVIALREGKLLEFLRQPRTLEDIVEAWIIYGRPREPKAFFAFGERGHMKKHLEKLMREGIVRREGERYLQA